MEDDAIPAATLVVLRDMPSGPPELLMVTRTSRMAFAAGAMVFPGGRIDDQDRALATSHEDAARVAAIRETIEETGLSIGLSPAAPAAMQDQLYGGKPLAALLEEHGLALQLSSLLPFARWKPNFKHSRRFDTFFFLARASDDRSPLRPQAGECDDALWITAAGMLERIAAGTASAIFPTIRNLERLAQFGSFDEAAAHALAHPVETISPWIEEADGEQWLRIPDHLGYPVVRERLNEAMRA